MSISLKDHEDRITVLEKGASSSVMKTVVLAEVNKDAIPSKINLSDVIDNYDMIVFKSAKDDTNGIMFSFHLPKYLPSNKDIRLSGTDNNFYHGKFNSDRKSITTIEENNYLFNIIGLKWGGGYKLRNFVKKISSLYQNILKTISLTILGGEVI